MRESIHDLLPVDGNRYFTSYGFYICKVTASESQGNTLKIKVTLLSERDASEVARVYRITGTRQEIKKERLRLVMDIHSWALLDRDAENYWVKKAQI